MHIEPAIVETGKIGISFLTAGGSFFYTIKALRDYFTSGGKVLSLILKTLIATFAVFSFFEIFPHYSVGISEVHLILGSTLFLIFGLAPTAIALGVGLLIQSLFFAPTDFPQYTINVTTLILSLMVMANVAERFIPKNIAYQDLKYSQVLKLSLSFQGAIVVWVAFWAFYFQGFGAENFSKISTFGLAYMSVVLLEPLIDLGVLFFAKSLAKFQNNIILTNLINSKVYKA